MEWRLVWVIFLCLGQFISATSGSGKFLPKIPTFISMGQKILISLGKKSPGQSHVGPLFIAGQEHARFSAHLQYGVKNCCVG